MTNTMSGSGDPEKKHNPIARTWSTAKRSSVKPATNKPTVGPQWAVTGSTRATDELIRSIPLVAIISLALLLKWTANDVQTLAAVVVPAFYWPGRGTRGV